MALSESGVFAETQTSKSSPLDLAELQRFFIAIRDELHRFLRRKTQNAAVAADLAQDLFLKLPNVKSAIPDQSQVRAYLFRMAGNLAIDHLRAEARKAKLLIGTEVLFEDACAQPDTVAVGRDELRQVEIALSELPARCREVLILARVHGLEHREIARRLGVSLSLVEKYQRRALRHCRDRLEDRN
jgi:RNA polymerase sigma factor (sigma-70 family)